MKLTDLSDRKRAGVHAHLEAINLLVGVTTVAIILSNGTDEERNEIRDMLRNRHGEEVYDPRTHRLVAIMAADREPSDGAKAIDDVTIGNPNASRVFDAVAEAFGRLTDGDHVQLDIRIDNDRVSIEHWSPPVRKETPMEPWDGSPVKPGEKISPTTATDIIPRPLAKFALEDQVMIKYGDELAGPAKIMGITHYLDAETQYLASYITKSGDPQSIWSAEGGLRAISDFRGADGPPSVATDYFPE